MKIYQYIAEINMEIDNFNQKWMNAYDDLIWNILSSR